MRRISGDRFVLQQDGAHSHTARHTIQFLNQHVPKYIEPGKVEDLNDLRREIVRALDEISQRFVSAPIDQWRDRLRECVVARGGHFEHLS